MIKRVILESWENATDVEVYKAFGKEQITRINKGKSERPFKNFKDKVKTFNGRNGLRKMTSKYNSLNDRIRKSEERQATMAESVGVKLKGNFEQRRSGWGNEEKYISVF